MFLNLMILENVLAGLGAQHFLATIKDGKLLLSGSQNFVLPLAGNDEMCAKLQTLMFENYLLESTKPLDILCFSFIEQSRVHLNIISKISLESQLNSFSILYCIFHIAMQCTSVPLNC